MLDRVRCYLGLPPHASETARPASSSASLKRATHPVFGVGGPGAVEGRVFQDPIDSLAPQRFQTLRGRVRDVRKGDELVERPKPFGRDLVEE